MDSEISAGGGRDIARTVGVVHHLSYVRTEEGLRRKMGAFSHAGEGQVCCSKRSRKATLTADSISIAHMEINDARIRDAKLLSNEDMKTACARPICEFVICVLSVDRSSGR